MIDFNYQALDSPLSRQDFADYKKQYPESIHISLPYYIEAFFTLALLYLPVFVVSLHSSTKLILAVIYFTIFVSFVWIFRSFITRSQKQKARLMKFAKDNNMHFNFHNSKKGEVVSKTMTDGVNQSLYFENNDLILELGNKGSSIDVQGYFRGFAVVTLSHALPDMVLDSKNNNSYGTSPFTSDINISSMLNLEDNFNNYYNLYVSKDYKAEALQIFSPDIMNKIIEISKSKFDVIISNKNIVALPKGKLKLTSSREIREILSILFLLREQIEKQTKNYWTQDKAMNIVADQQLAESVPVPKDTMYYLTYILPIVLTVFLLIPFILKAKKIINFEPWQYIAYYILFLLAMVVLLLRVNRSKNQ